MRVASFENRERSHPMLILLLWSAFSVPLFATGDDPDTDRPEPDDFPTDEPRGEKQLTLIVLLSIFGFCVVFVVALCCVKRQAIGKALLPDQDNFAPLPESRPYTGTPGFSDLTTTPQLWDLPRSWYG
jgi:hypothetical protein